VAKPRPWDGLADPRAAALLREAHRLSGLRDPWGPPPRVGGEAQYALWLDEALRQSDLAAQMRSACDSLPASTAPLPDVLPALPWYARWLEALRRPSTPRGMVKRVGYYLEWYVQPRHSARVDLSILRKAGPLACYYCLHWPVMFAVIIAMWIDGMLLTLAGGITAIVLVLAGLFNITDLLVLPLILRGASPRQRINRAALYLHLRDRLGK
jgi:hypothetical protein